MAGILGGGPLSKKHKVTLFGILSGVTHTGVSVLLNANLLLKGIFQMEQEPLNAGKKKPG